jgi:hypothetical protein
MPAGRGLLNVDALQAIEGEELGDLHRNDLRIELAHGHHVADLDAAVEDAADGDPPQVVARVEVGVEQLQRRFGIAPGRRHMLDDGVEQRPQVGAVAVHLGRRGPDLGVGIEHGKFELVFAGVEIDEQVVDFVEDFLRPRVGPIDLVDDDDWREAALERLAQHEPGLRQRAFRRVDQQHHAVDHRQRAFDLAAEVGVARRVDDVDQQVVIVNRGVLGENRDPALAFEIVAVHGAFGDALVGTEGTALVQQGINQGGLAVVNVGDDGDVTSGRICYGHPPSIAASHDADEMPIAEWESIVRAARSRPARDPQSVHRRARAARRCVPRRGAGD